MTTTSKQSFSLGLYGKNILKFESKLGWNVPSYIMAL
jgi:hypothetical protein